VLQLVHAGNLLDGAIVRVARRAAELGALGELECIATRRLTRAEVGRVEEEQKVLALALLEQNARAALAHAVENVLHSAKIAHMIHRQTQLNSTKVTGAVVQ
jgi:hypothetical protein